MMNRDKSINAPRILVLCDFDGTASAVDVGHHLLKHFADESWEKIDADYCSGTIGSMVAYRQIAETIHASEGEFHRCLGPLIQLEPSFPEFCRYCEEKGHVLKIVSDGLDFYIHRILRHYHLEQVPFFSNQLIFEENGEIAIGFPMENPACRTCGTCKKSILESSRKQFDYVIYIGDGHSDFCPSRFADLVFAKRILYQHSLANGLPCIPFKDFKEIQDYMENHAHEISGTLSDQTLGGR